MDFKNYKQKRCPNNKKGQIWSMDIMIAVFIFLATVTLVLYALSVDLSDAGVKNVKKEGESIPNLIFSEDESTISLMTDNELDLDKLKTLNAMNYDEIRAELGINSEFCIFIEDMDGNILNISEITSGGTDVGIGSSRVNVSSGVVCSQG